MNPDCKTYKHAEAYCLMWYVCENNSCGHRERIWNSRDGVTAFGTTCPSCGKIMNHCQWQNDVCVPDYKLNIGQKFWRDGTKLEGMDIMMRRIANYRLHYPDNIIYVSIAMQSAREETDEWKPGWPKLDIYLGD